jgi:formate-dependent nitrite reductase cytochrome c552 subunit
MPHYTLSPVTRLGLALLALVPAAALGGDLVGPEGCKTCHQAAWESWRDTAHARAQESLPPRHRQDLRCTVCHAPDQDKGVAGVSCEACHGPGQAYAASYVMRDPELARAVGLSEGGEKTCLQCHTESAPSLGKFEYARKLELIRHPR